MEEFADITKCVGDAGWLLQRRGDSGYVRDLVSDVLPLYAKDLDRIREILEREFGLKP